MDLPNREKNPAVLAATSRDPLPRVTPICAAWFHAACGGGGCPDCGEAPVSVRCDDSGGEKLAASDVAIGRASSTGVLSDECVSGSESAASRKWRGGTGVS